MPFVLAPVEEQDALEWSKIHYDAFSPLLGFLWKHPPTEESFKKIAKDRAATLTKPDTRVIKVVDTETGMIAGIASWNFYPRERTPEELEESLTDLPYPEEDNVEARKGFIKSIFGARRNILGTRPCFLLGVLIVRPQYQRRGVGHMLMDWGTKEGDRLGLLGYLESSINGLVLYERFGYVKHSELLFDKRPYGGDGFDKHTVMFRQPKPLSAQVTEMHSN